MATIDTTPPIVISSEPANHATNVLVDSRIVVEFKDDIKAGSGYIIISNGQGDTRRLAIHDRSQVQIDNVPSYDLGVYLGHIYSRAYHRLSIKPRENWLSNSRYYVQVDAGAITSASGTPLAGVTDTTTYSFTTHADATAPIPLSAEYTLDSKGLSTITATFNEPLAFGYREGAVLTNRQGDTRELSVYIGLGSNQAIFHEFDLRPNTTYFLTVPPGFLSDLANNPFAGVPDASAFTFESGNDYSREPTIAGIGVKPGFVFENSLGIAQDIEVGFNRAVKIGAGNITLSDGRGDTRVIAVDDHSQVRLAAESSDSDCFDQRKNSCDNETGSILTIEQTFNPILTINPSDNLLPNSQYTVQLDPGVVTNLAGKPFAGTTKTIQTMPVDTTPISAYNIRFYSPADGVGRSTISVDFNQLIRGRAGNIIISNGQGDTRTIAVNDKRQVLIGDLNRLLMISPSEPLLPDTHYFVLVDDGAFTNVSGHPLAGVQDPTAVTFTTTALDPVPPPISNSVEEINHGSSQDRYEDRDVLVFHFSQPVKDYASFELSNGHTFGGNDLVLSPDRLSASVELTAASTVAPGDVLTFAVRNTLGSVGVSYFKLGEYVLFKL